MVGLIRICTAEGNNAFLRQQQQAGALQNENGCERYARSRDYLGSLKF